MYTIMTSQLSSESLLLLLLFCFTVSSTEGLTATCAAAFKLS